MYSIEIKWVLVIWQKRFSILQQANSECIFYPSNIQKFMGREWENHTYNGWCIWHSTQLLRIYYHARKIWTLMSSQWSNGLNPEIKENGPQELKIYTAIWIIRRTLGVVISGITPKPYILFISMNLLQMSSVITWAWSFMNSEVVEAVKGQKYHISVHTKKWDQLWFLASIQPPYLKF